MSTVFNRELALRVAISNLFSDRRHALEQSSILSQRFADCGQGER
jgi:hypothetical protein